MGNHPPTPSAWNGLLIRAQVNTFPLDSEVKSLADLSDGLVFARMLGACELEIPFTNALNLAQILNRGLHRGHQSRIRCQRCREEHNTLEMAAKEESPRGSLPIITPIPPEQYRIQYQ